MMRKTRQNEEEDSVYVTLFPAWHAIEGELSDAGEWASELVRWYESDWRAALCGGPPPVASRVVDQLDPARRDVAHRLFQSIDDHYRSKPRLGSRGTLPEADDPTVELPPQRMRTPSGVDQVVGEQNRSPPIGYDHVRKATAAFTSNVHEHDHQRINRSASFDFSTGTKTHPSDRATDIHRAHRDAQVFPEIPGYSIESVLGRGGMGVVYLARQNELDRLVALKMILAGDHASEHLTERFLAEARAVARLQHENIVRVHEIGWHKTLPYFSLEFVDGPSLSDQLAGKPMLPEQAAGLLAQISLGLDSAHNAGIVHRDVKPSNVLITSNGIPKLADFGLAKHLESQADLSRTGDLIGTPSFMSPEQARGDKNITAAADIYGLGAVLYTMLTGRPPFLAAKPMDTILQVLETEPIAPSKLQPGVPKDLETICLKCLRKETSQRYGSATEVHADLQRFLAGEPIQARPVSRLERVYRWSRRKPLVAALTAAASLLALTLMIGGPIVAAVINGQKRELVVANQLAESNALAATAARELAEDNAAKAKSNEILAIANAARADDNARQAEQNADAARTQQKNAVDALKSLVFEVQRRMTDQPALQSLRQSLLQVASDGVERMEATSDGAASSNIISAAIHRRLGELNLQLGRLSSARADYTRCLEILQQLKREDKLTNERHNLSTVYELLAEVARRAGDLADARVYAEACLEQRQAWLDENPENENIRQNFATTLGQLGTLAQEQGDMQSARSYLTRTAELRKRFFESQPGVVEAEIQWIGARRALANLAFQEGHFDTCKQQMSQVIADQLDVVRRFPQSNANQGNLALFHADLAMMHLYTGQFPESVAQYQAGEEVIENLIQQDPDNLEWKDMQGAFLYGLSVAQREVGDASAADETIGRAIALRKLVLEADPDSIARQVSYILALARGHQLSLAVPLLEKVEPTAKAEGAVFYNLACCYAQLVGALSQTGSAEEALDETWKTRSLELIEQAYQQGFRRSTDLQFDPDLMPVRDDPRYQELLQRQRP